jgi:hypothetical protein
LFLIGLAEGAGRPGANCNAELGRRRAARRKLLR